MAAKGNTPYAAAKRMGSAKSNEFSLVSQYKLGYRNREDVTNLPPGVLITGSQNVMTNVSERIQIRQGYTLDGATSAVLASVANSFDWLSKQNGEVNVRVGGLTSAGNDGSLQYRYVDSSGVVTWRDLATSLATVAYNFTTYWNITESLREMLYVNGTANIFKWNGAVTTLASATINTVTKQGTNTWTDTGFYTTGTRTIVIGGVSATYTGGEGTTTLTGVSVDFSATIAGSVVHQLPITTAISSMTAITATFTAGLISTLNNQVFVSSLTSPVIWISRVNSFTDYSGSTPRQAGEGASLILDANIVAFKPQEQFMYVSAGKDLWYNVNFSLQTSAVGVTYEQVNALRLKTGQRQGVISQAFVSHMKNNIIMVTNETTVDLLGRIENYFGTPQTKNLSDPIKYDVDSYDFTNGSIAYFKDTILVAVPVEGLVLIFNLTNNAWESPQTLPISRFYIVNGELYGHSYNTFESYKLFTGYADRVYSGFAGYPIPAVATFSYQNYGTRATYKKANAFYMEGYVSSNTTITITLTYELDGCATTRTFTIDGSDTQIVCIPSSLASLGKNSLGKIKLGGASSGSIQDLPPKFRVEKTFNNKNFFECSMSFSILGVDQNFQLLAWGLNASNASEEPVQIRQ